MSEKLVPAFRFRDLVTPPGGTIAAHRRVIESSGSAWWGWWKRQFEVVPRESFIYLQEQIEGQGVQLGLLVDTGMQKIYQAKIIGIRVALDEIPIPSPDHKLTPGYYQSKSYSAWFQITDISDVNLADLHLVLHSLPTLPDSEDVSHEELIAKRIEKVSDLRKTDATFWIFDNTFI